ncbi:hypothetical protein C7S20_07730 [Christiangramia fulva]|uniref:Uncharacterized protein n=1 Tax=Christiangramia fulva TaxID=2126553 RepID=A0A2R3Z4N0_9FLAO|nr:hypothetical protein [Christiangramia fulva]AVR45172.1 hypothetical protein C7S20_07730 [Christiangramia fulva]
MRSFKKILRLFGFILFITLAMLGVSLSGGVPPPVTNKRKGTIENIIEVEEPLEEDSEEFEYIKKE